MSIPQGWGKHSADAPEPWRAEAACRPINGVTVTHLFYAPDGRYESPAERSARLVQAEALCRSCRVRGECKAWVLSYDVDPVGDGYCAGMSPEHRHERRERRLLGDTIGNAQLALAVDAMYGDGELSVAVYGPSARRELTA